MGGSQSSYEDTREKPATKTSATLYYFAGRGLADQIRWMLAASEVSFTQRVIDTRARFVKMAERQLPFGQLPLLQIDGLEIVQSQAIVRYLAERGNLIGKTTTEKVKCEMIAEAVRDLLPDLCAAPFMRPPLKSKEEFEGHLAKMREKWIKVASRLEAILVLNGGRHLVANQLTYADILVAHALTWYVEECGPQIVENMPNLVGLQNTVISLPGIQTFIKSQAYYPLGDEAYCKQVNHVLGKTT